MLVCILACEMCSFRVLRAHVLASLLAHMCVCFLVEALSWQGPRRLRPLVSALISCHHGASRIRVAVAATAAAFCSEGGPTATCAGHWRRAVRHRPADGWLRPQGDADGGGASAQGCRSRRSSAASGAALCLWGGRRAPRLFACPRPCAAATASSPPPPQQRPTPNLSTVAPEERLGCVCGHGACVPRMAAPSRARRCAAAVLRS